MFWSHLALRHGHAFPNTSLSSPRSPIISLALRLPPRLETVYLCIATGMLFFQWFKPIPGSVLSIDVFTAGYRRDTVSTGHMKPHRDRSCHNATSGAGNFDASNYPPLKEAWKGDTKA